MEAWVTSAGEDDAVNKAIVLAGSLRNVKTAKKSVVFSTSSVSQELREKLKNYFDLVVLIDPKTCANSGLGLTFEDCAKVEAFSLMIFNKCVFLSANTLVIKNCDHIFDSYGPLALFKSNGDIEANFCMFTPSIKLHNGLKKHIQDNEKNSFETWILNQVPTSQVITGSLILNVEMKGKDCSSWHTKDTAILSFVDAHPLDLPLETWDLKHSGRVGKFALEYAWKIFKGQCEMLENTIECYCNSNPYTNNNQEIAIIGMSFRLPGGNNVNEFWDLLKNGKESIKEVPQFRWTKEQNARVPCKNRKVEAGFLDFPIDEFDAKFFGVSPKEAVFLDPQQRLLHEVTWEALEDAGIDPLTLRGTQTGVFVGSWIHDYKDIAARATDVDFFRVYMGNSIAAEAARLSYFLGTTGPSIATESGCSSAIVGVDLACKSLRRRETNLAVACGVNLLIHPFDKNTLSFVLAPDGRCKTFDANANGFGRSEACGVLVMKRMADAIKDGDNIWGLVRGSAITQEGLSKSLGTPTVHCEALAMELALKDAGVEPHQVSFVETHGTGTPVGDPMEVAAIAKVYSKGRTEPLVIGSVKTNVGHTEAASGIVGIIKVLLSMKNEMIPQHLHLQTINPEINLSAIPAKIPTASMPWPRDDEKPRLAGVSSFGISGTDGHAIIEEPPKICRSQIDFELKRPLHIMKISAKSSESFEKLLNKYETILSEKCETSLESFADMAYSANTGRSTFNYRAVIIAQDFDEGAKILKDKSYKKSNVQAAGSSLCYLFTGQGSQYPNMAASLYKTSPVFQMHFDMCSQILQKKYDIDIKDVLWNETENADKLSQTLFSQTSIFCIEYCLLKLWESWGVKPDYVLGHSLGEFCAAVAANILSFEDALMLVAERSRLIDSLPRGKMLVIKSDKKSVENAMAKYKQTYPKFWADFAAFNSSDQTVIAGNCDAISDFAKFCAENSLKAILLASSHAFHSRHMNPILEKYGAIASTVQTLNADANSAPKFISGMDGKLLDSSDVDANYWVRHTREPVRFINACKVVQEESCTMFLEVGPHPVLSALTMMNIEGSTVTCLPSIRRKECEWTTILESLSKLYLSDWKGEVDWTGFDQHYNRQRVSLPFYPFNRKPVWVLTKQKMPEMHPLLGKLVPNASSQTIFEHSVTLKNVDFVQDHVIGNTVVFPGACFLEMCLSGGYCSVQGISEDMQLPRRPVALKGLKIASPLALYDSDLCILQTVATFEERQDEDDEIGYGVTVSRRLKGGGDNQWILHASARYIPVIPTGLSDNICKIDVEEMQKSWKESTQNKIFYEKLPEAGLRFGPKFQSLECGWKSDDGLLLQVKVPTESQGKFLVHPVVADAMIQAAMLWASREKMKKKLQVPVHIGEFVWLAESSCNQRFVYCSETSSGVVYTLLVDELGTPLAYMAGVDFAETTVKLVEGMIQQQLIALPKLWEEIWKAAPGSMQNSLNLLESPIYKPLSAEMEKTFLDMNDVGKDETQFYETICEFTRVYFLQALYKLGWVPQVGVTFTVEHLLSTLKIQKSFYLYLNYFLNSFVEKGVLSKSDDTFSFKSTPPTMEQLEDELNNDVKSQFLSRGEYRMIREIGVHLAKVLTGEMEPLKLLFPGEPGKPDASQIYIDVSSFTRDIGIGVNHVAVFPYVLEAMKKNRRTNFDERPILRILEIGAGTGAFARVYMKCLVDAGIEFEYHFTDISAAFFTSADLGEYAKYVNFKRLNMEEDPLAQGFCPEYYDILIAAEVLHVAKDVRKTLINLRSLVKPAGVFQIVETVAAEPRLTYIFGLLSGYWQFEDFDFRPSHTTLTPEKWEEALKLAHFPEFYFSPGYNNIHGFMIAIASNETGDVLRNLGDSKHSWIIFDNDTDMSSMVQQKLRHVNRKIVVVDKPKKFTEDGIKEVIKIAIGEASKCHTLEGVIYLWGVSSYTCFRDQTEISLPFMTLCQFLTTMDNIPKISVVTSGVSTSDCISSTNPSSGTLTGIVRAVRNENLHMQISHMDLSQDLSVENGANEVFYNLWRDKGEIIAVGDGQRKSPRLAAFKLENQYLTLPKGCERYQLQLSQTRLIADLEFTYLEPHVLQENEVEVQVKAMALNFRDVFAVIKPIPMFDNFNTVGLDFAGVITKVGTNVKTRKVGDHVIGMNLNENLALPSHIKVGEHLVTNLPNQFTFQEGVTLPAVFATSVYCLINVAKMKKGETVLIHTASGGVGLCAVQLAKKTGAHIIATAGSRRKRTFLKNLGIEHVFNSRTTDFKNDILKATGGKGVDIVLNSITGSGFKEASLDVLGSNGRFVEMSKLNVWNEEEVKSLRPDVFYSIVDLTTLEKSEYTELMDNLRDYLESGSIKPISYERFDALNIRGALNYLQKAKHIGKIVCVMPEVKIVKSKFESTAPLFNENSTYLVTGGLGGIGFEVVKWILVNGGKYVAIASRSPPKADVQAQIDAWNKEGKYVRAYAVDVGNFDECHWLMNEIHGDTTQFPQLRGIMHAAGILQDATIENQNWSKFLQTYNAKVDGTWHLHDLTKDFLLEHFVVFSSIAALIGSPGQTNHSASNSFEDAMTHYRQSIGLTATCINWGAWGEVGIATEVEFPGARSISTSQGLLALETFLRSPRKQTVVVDIESFSLLCKLFPSLKTYVDDRRLFGEIKSNLIVNSDEFWADVDKAVDRDEKLDVFKKFIKTTIKNLLKLDHDEVIDDNAEFQSIGVDSLMMLEMKNGLQNILGSRITLSAGQLKDCNTTQELAYKLVDLLEGREEEMQNIPTVEELNVLIREDSSLAAHVIPGEIPAKTVDSIETILLTGVTGNLGPYLLYELSQRQNITKIICLVRKSGKYSSSERLHLQLTRCDLIDKMDMSKVECIQGDLTSPQFGLSDQDYDALSSTVDAVFHSAVRSDHIAKYWKAPPTLRNNVRTVNVMGTVRVLEFAVSKRTKQVFYASTLLTVTTVDEDGCFSEEWQHVGAFDNVTYNAGYPLSKHVAEQLIKHAVSQGIPCKTFRLPAIGGDVNSGRCEFERNHFLLQWIGFMKLRCMPDFPCPLPLVSVNCCAKLAVEAFFSPKAISDVYNMSQKNPIVEQELIKVASDHFDIEIEPVSYKDFIEKLKAESDSSPLAAFKKTYEDENVVNNLESPSILCLQKYLLNSDNFFRCSKLSEVLPNFNATLESGDEVMRRDLEYLKKLGIFKRFGL